MQWQLERFFQGQSIFFIGLVNSTDSGEFTQGCINISENGGYICLSFMSGDMTGCLCWTVVFCVLKVIVWVEKKEVFAAVLIKKRCYGPKHVPDDTIVAHFADKGVGEVGGCFPGDN